MQASSSASLKRSVSKRFKEGTTTPLKAQELLNLVKEMMKKLPKHMQIPHLKDKSVAQLDQILDDELHLRSVASLAAQCDAARLKLTQPVHRDVNIRILALLATDAQLLDLYKSSLCATTQQMLDAGCDPNSNTGKGMGLNHKYHQELELKFNDIAICPDFPFEYYESDCGPAVHSDGSFLTCPAKIRGGLFAAFSLLQARKPEGFPNAFFSIEMLDKIFVAGKTEYHNMMSRWDVSGQHGGKPMWFRTGCTCGSARSAAWARRAAAASRNPVLQLGDSALQLARATSAKDNTTTSSRGDAAAACIILLLLLPVPTVQ
jgi:hypothetical protein